MKCYFIFNPISGGGKKKRGKNDNTVFRHIRDICHERSYEYDVYFTKCIGDAEDFARRKCREHFGELNDGEHDGAGGLGGFADANREEIRFYAFGGDGTLNEIINGAYGYDNVEIGVIPRGTGNDFVRNFQDPEFFESLKHQIWGGSRTIDLIRYKTEYKGKSTVRYCANMFNIGFDCNVVATTEKAKKMPLMGGSTAYLTSVMLRLAQKKCTKLRIEYDNGDVRDEEVLLTSIGNGGYCGGGIYGLPRTSLNDGLMDVSVVRNISRRLFISLFPSYSKGEHLENDRLIKHNVIDYRQERRIKITANEGSMRLCTDGEISEVDSVEFEVVPDAFRFICVRDAQHQ